MTGIIVSSVTCGVIKEISIIDYDLPIETDEGNTGSVTFVGNIEEDVSTFALYVQDIQTWFKILDKSSSSEQLTTTTLTISDGIELCGDEFSAFNLINTTTTPDPLEDPSFLFKLSTFYLFSDWRGLFHYDYQYTDDDDVKNISIPATRYGFQNFAFGVLPYSKDTVEISSELQTNIDSLGVRLCDMGGKYIGRYYSNGAYHYCTVITKTQFFRGMRQYGYAPRINIKDELRLNLQTVPPSKDKIKALTYALSFNPQIRTSIPIFFGDGHSTLISAAFDNDVCTFINFVRSGNNANVGTITQWFLASDLTAHVYPTAGYTQLQGYETSTVIDSAPTSADAEDIFSKNTWAHRVEFYSDKELHIGQPVKLMLESGTLDTAISQVRMVKGDSRFKYTCGELPTSAAEKIHANSWSYGQRLPYKPYKGQLVMM